MRLQASVTARGVWRAMREGGVTRTSCRVEHVTEVLTGLSLPYRFIFLVNPRRKQSLKGSGLAIPGVRGDRVVAWRTRRPV